MTNKLIGYGFDPSGNTTADAQGRTFVYDGENKQVEVKDGSNATVGQYWYDGGLSEGEAIQYLVSNPNYSNRFRRTIVD
ncbi:MAG: hypothetical protein IT173_07930 [Acidobacteria bacterium]|nr:hypothetical protein [Acidobacteriota bacterium]